MLDESSFVDWTGSNRRSCSCLFARAFVRMCLYENNFLVLVRIHVALF